MSNVAAVFSVSIFIILTGWIFLRINDIQAGPYMDEIFHVPQAQTYCSGNYSYVSTLLDWFVEQNVNLVELGLY